MQQVKIFKTVEAEVGALENDVNAWIRESQPRIISITGNIAPQSSPSGGGSAAKRFAPSDVLMIVLYETAES